MNHRRVHDIIINKAICLRGNPKSFRDKRFGFHIHHITPRCFGGRNSSENLAILTPREHFIVHWLLWKMHGGKMATAFRMMTGADHTSGRMTSKVYASLCADAAANSFSDAGWKKNHYDAINRKETHPEWYKNTTEAARKRAKDSEWLRKNIESVRRVTKTDGWKRANIAGNIRRSKPVIGFNDDSVICLIGYKDMQLHGFNGKCISSVLRGASKTYNGYSWRLATREEVEQLRPGHAWLELTKDK